MEFSKLQLQGWRQFEHIDIEFHPRLTVLTGANGAGKSTLLRLLSQHYGWHQPLLATPTYTKEGALRYFSGIFEWFRKRENPSATRVGKFVYSDSSEAMVTIPTVGSITYNVQITPQHPVQGLHIGSHRPLPTYQNVANIPTNAIGAERAFQLYHHEEMQRYQNSYTQFSPIYRMKEAIISMATFGPGNQYVQRNNEIAVLFEKFKEILSKVLPENIGFKDINVRIPDVVLVTETGDFIIDAASGGLMSIIDLSWQIFLYSHNKEHFVVTMDEPENHLHPSMQRTLLARLLAAFPKAQFIVATHSPFVVSSVKDSTVYVLGYSSTSQPNTPDVNRTVSSLKLDHANKAGTASEILRDVLGVAVTLPEWAEDDLRRISAEFHIDTLNPANIQRLRARLNQEGLGEYYPEALHQIAGSQ